MTDIETRVIATIRKELGEVHWTRVERINGEITPDTELSDLFESEAIDRVCVICALDEEFDIELPDAALESWATVGDVVASVVSLYIPEIAA